jgi:transposase
MRKGTRKIIYCSRKIKIENRNHSYLLLMLCSFLISKLRKEIVRIMEVQSNRCNRRDEAAIVLLIYMRRKKIYVWLNQYGYYWV